jgi:dihydrodipicolinate synthase/N-acetylneuraminate lyase
MRGVFPPMITPLIAPDQLDVSGLERLTEFLLAGGVNGLFVLGTTGEAPALSYRLREQVIERTCRQVAGRVPVMVGVIDTSAAEAIRLARKAADAGANFVVVAPPYYFPASQAEIGDYIAHVAAESPLPVMLYKAPSNVGTVLEPPTVLRLAELPNVAGLKDSGFNMIYFHKLVWMLRDRPEFTLLVGPEELTAEAVLMGGHGGMCGGANFCPKLYMDLYRAAAAGNLEEVNRLQKRVIQISATVYNVAPGEPSSYLRGLKCAVSLMGLCGDTLATPVVPFSPAQREEVRRRMAAAGLLESR